MRQIVGLTRFTVFVPALASMVGAVLLMALVIPEGFDGVLPQVNDSLQHVTASR
jgi:hypothetical protein